jgi:hypothetical protein|tara:strand:- start:302 stop:532 length:231 start_codon:yes stop_codon:yes gene_type:complete
MKLSKANEVKVQSVELEECPIWSEKAYWVELNKGFCFPDRGSHCFSEDTQALIRRSLSMVVKCDCDECSNNNLKAV